MLHFASRKPLKSLNFLPQIWRSAADWIGGESALLGICGAVQRRCNAWERDDSKYSVGFVSAMITHHGLEALHDKGLK